jgi:hypothetical protein
MAGPLVRGLTPAVAAAVGLVATAILDDIDVGPGSEGLPPLEDRRRID